LVLTRQGFEATLELDNRTADTLSEIAIALEVTDAAGYLVNERFGITEPMLFNPDAVDGIGIAQWTLAPNDSAAPSGPVQYCVGGTLSYREGDYDVVVNLFPVPINVEPNASLEIDDFHQRDIYADNPFTDEIKPSISCLLGIVVKNNSAGAARSLRIDSGQPEIIENDKGLLIDFDIIATRLGHKNIMLSLGLDVGDIGAG